jgi:hypothetical protein
MAKTIGKTKLTLEVKVEGLLLSFDEEVEGYLHV